MFRIDDPSAVATMPVPEAGGVGGFFTEGVPGTLAATLVRASWLNAIQEELISIIVASGQAPSKTDFKQLLKALRSPGTFQTAAQFDASTAVATMAALQRELGNHSGFIGVEVNTALTAAHAGMILSNNAPGVIFDLPLAASVRIGTTIYIQPRNSCTVNSANGIILGTLTGLPSVSMAAGESCDFTSNGTTWYATGGSLFVRPIGVGQTWKNLAASRALNTNYTNTTGRPIMVAAGLTTDSEKGTAIINIDGVQIGGSSNYNAGAPQAFAMAIVPAGSVYRVAGTAGISTLQSWAELR